MVWDTIIVSWHDFDKGEPVGFVTTNRIIYLSTSLVYGEGLNHTESDKLNPGSKEIEDCIKHENWIRKEFENYVILRLTPGYGFPLSPVSAPEQVSKGLENQITDKYIKYALSKISSNQPVLAAHDVFYSPVWCYDIYALIGNIFNTKKFHKGVYNFGGSESISQVDLAYLIAGQIGIDRPKVIKVSRLDSPLAKELRIAGMPFSNGVVCLKIYRHFKPGKRTDLGDGISRMFKYEEELREHVPDYRSR